MLPIELLMKSGEERRAPLCNSCCVGLTIQHILIACPAFDSERRAASLHGKSMSEVLDNECCIRSLMLFLRNTGFVINFKPHLKRNYLFLDFDFIVSCAF